MNININQNKDTIAAIATTPGYSGIGIIRISGTLTYNVTKKILGLIPKNRKASYLPFKYKNNIIDYGIAIFFNHPNSFTGEDMLELHCHGGPVILNTLLQYIISLPSIRIANPGEFSMRAFLNKKIDLVQAESIIDLINSNSLEFSKKLINVFEGNFSYKIKKLIGTIDNLYSHIEAMINFPDDQLEQLSNDTIISTLDNVISIVNKLNKQVTNNIILRDGIKIVIIGRPNVGKSSLFNALIGCNNAIVTSSPGTTRDVLRYYINLDGITINISDTAGIHNTNNFIEKIGIKHSLKEIKTANHILLVVDSTICEIKKLNHIYNNFIKIVNNIPITIIRNKADLSHENISINKLEKYHVITISAKLKKGLDLIFNHIKDLYIKNNYEFNNVNKHRYFSILNNVILHLRRGKENYLYCDILLEELKYIKYYLDSIIGNVYDNKLLDKIFSKFCIGK
ncbi:MAG: tRNA uridine-5-carboxymethylaminomethyl(34) synthesis GTPase MnmE [Candidatus Lightella neohaematopini]|nr:tRNA uridine-5-carboxymethylaminomethyl(34) synthesis GTPase MnmE [Candidatus Lightella neohaematopini]